MKGKIVLNYGDQVVPVFERELGENYQEQMTTIVMTCCMMARDFDSMVMTLEESADGELKSRITATITKQDMYLVEERWVSAGDMQNDAFGKLFGK
jgi:hypothetical protein